MGNNARLMSCTLLLIHVSLVPIPIATEAIYDSAISCTHHISKVSGDA